MKKLQAISLVLISLFFFGCAQEEPTTNPDHPETPVTEVEETQEKEEAVKKELSEDEMKRIYAKWAMPANHSMTESMGEDCTGVLNGNTNGGDLMSSLIVDDELRERMNLNRHSKSYVASMEKRLAAYTQTRHASDFYAFSVCNVGDNKDLVSGHLWPTGKATGENPSWHEDKVLLFASEESVVEIDRSVKLLNNTATGAEVSPCTGELSGNTIAWSCFLGLHEDAGDLRSNMGIWEISANDGKILNYRTEVK